MASRMEDRMYHLAREMDDRTGGNSEIVMDWGNISIHCKALGGDSPELKELLVAMAKDYVRLRDQEAAVLKAMGVSRVPH